MIYFVLFVSLVLVYFYCMSQYKLPILMYHHILPKAENDLVVSVEQFEAQLKFLKENHYTTLFFSELMQMKKCPKRSIILTFDDGYINNLEYAYPLLKKYGMKATIMIPTAQIDCDEDKMTTDQIKQMSSEYIELGLHSHTHTNYAHITPEQASKDIDDNINSMKQKGLRFTNVFAYPYGQYPKRDALKKKALFEVLSQKNIIYALRIGNGLNDFPFSNPYQVKRIHIKHNDTLLKFKLKLIFGKLKPF